MTFDCRKEAPGPLQEYGVPVRRRGAEHTPLGKLFDYKQSRVHDVHRKITLVDDLGNRCLRCSTDDALGIMRSTGRKRVTKQSIICNECVRQARVAEVEREKLIQAEEDNRIRVEKKLSKTRAKEKRALYAYMFRPKMLQPLPSRLTAYACTPVDAAATDEEYKQSNARMLLPPPSQLESLLPKAYKTKDEFIKTVEYYERQRREAEHIRWKTKSDILKKKKALEANEEEQKRKEHNERLVRNALVRLRNKSLCLMFSTWKENIDFLKKRRLLGRFSSVYKMEMRWIAWRQYLEDWKLEKYCAALVIQACARRVSAKKVVEKRRANDRAARCIQSFGRSVLAKNVLKLAKGKLAAQERLIKKSLMKLWGNLQTKIFYVWKHYVEVLGTVRVMAKRSGRHLLVYCVRRWKLYTAEATKERHEQALENMQRYAFGFIARLRFAALKTKTAAATKIQGMYRAKAARNVLRMKLRQRRIVRKKLVRALGEKKLSYFLSWKEFTGQIKILKTLLSGSRIKTLRRRFDIWTDRRRCAIVIQAVFRGYMGKNSIQAVRTHNYEEILEQGIVKDEEKATFGRLLDNKYQSPLLIRLRDDLLRVKRVIMAKEAKQGLLDKFGIKEKRTKKNAMQFLFQIGRRSSNASTDNDDDEYTKAQRALLENFTSLELNHPDLIELNIHGSLQQFYLSKHSAFLIRELTKLIDKEIARLAAHCEKYAHQVQKEAMSWEETLKDFLGNGNLVYLKEFKSYHNAGKSFDIKIQTIEDAEESIHSWKEMYTLGYISRWTALSWITEGLLLREGARSKERMLCWTVLLKSFDRAFLEDLAAYVLSRIEDNRTKLD